MSEHVDPAVTRRVVGVDVNLQYLALARQRQMRLGSRLELYCTEAEKVLLDAGSFDLAFAGLFFEHAAPGRLAGRSDGDYIVGPVPLQERLP